MVKTYSATYKQAGKYAFEVREGGIGGKILSSGKGYASEKEARKAEEKALIKLFNFKY